MQGNSDQYMLNIPLRRQYHEEIVVPVPILDLVPAGTVLQVIL